MNEIKARLSRSQLYVPASRPDMIGKAANSSADAVCMDLEDSVAPDQKEASRKNIIEALQQVVFGPRVRMFRINGLDTPFAYRDVIDIVEKVGDKIDLIMLPKVQKPDDVMFLDTLLSQIESHKGFSNRIGIEVQIESASGIVNLREIGQASDRLEALIFGPGDYAASMKMPLANIGERDLHDEVYPGHRWHAAMHAIVGVARTNGLRCIDGPFASFKDEEGFEEACRVALAMGFDGKQCIHPAQISIVNRTFSPSKEEVDWAQRVVAAYENAAKEGLGVVSLEGKMVDAANIRMAQTISHRYQAIKGKSEM